MTSTTDAPRIGLGMPRVPGVRGRLKDIPVPGHKRVLLAAPRGYCAGVDRAVIAVEKALEHYGAPVYVRKQIVHNIHVVTELEQQGAIFVDEVDEVPEGAHIVFSAHGVSPGGRERRRRPRPARDRRDVPARDQGAPRGRALRARRLRDPAHRPRGPRGGRGHRRRGARRTSPSSTAPTTCRTSTCATPTRWSGSRRPRSRSTRPWRRCAGCASGSRTCRTRRATTSATPRRTARWRSRRSRQDADLVIVVGSANSSNSVRLVEVALEYGAKAAYRVDYASEVKQEWLDGVATVGVTSGASVPEELVQGAARRPRRRRLRRRGRGEDGRGGPDVLAAEGAAPRPRRATATSAALGGRARASQA